MNAPSGLLEFGLISKKTGVKIDLFPAIIISFTINYSILSTSETHESFYVTEKPFVSEYVNACFHIFLILNARTTDSIVRECLLKANLWQMCRRNRRQPAPSQGCLVEESRAGVFEFAFTCIKE